MKSVRLCGPGLLAALIALAASAWAAPIVPVAHYRFDEPAGAGSVSDWVGSAHGTLTGDPTQGVAGRIGQACYFDGAGDGVKVAHAAAASLKPTDDFTVTCWLNPKSLTSEGPSFKYERVVDASGAGGSIPAGYRLMLNEMPVDKSRLTFLVRNQTSSPRVREDQVDVLTYRWYFAAARYDKDDKFKITVYDPGAGVTYTTEGTSPTAIDYGSNPIDVYLARSVSDHYFDTVLDDLAVWNGVLADDQLAHVASHGAAAPIPTLHWNAADAPVHDGTRDEWLPRVGSGYDWNFQNANGPDQVPSGSYPLLPTAYRYTGDENVRFSDAADTAFAFNQFDQTASASFEMWFRPDSLAGGKQVLWETGGVNGASLTINDDELRFGTASSSGPFPEVGLTYTLTEDDLSSFIHLVGVYDKEGNQTRMYVDSVLVGLLGTVTANWSGNNAAGLGTRQDSATGGFANSGSTGGPDEGVGPGVYGTFLGDIAVFNFYDYALDNQQVYESWRAIVPEPATLSLLGLGALGLLARRRRRR